MLRVNACTMPWKGLGLTTEPSKNAERSLVSDKVENFSQVLLSVSGEGACQSLSLGANQACQEPSVCPAKTINRGLNDKRPSVCKTLKGKKVLSFCCILLSRHSC